MKREPYTSDIAYVSELVTRFRACECLQKHLKNAWGDPKEMGRTIRGWINPMFTPKFVSVIVWGLLYNDEKYHSSVSDTWMYQYLAGLLKHPNNYHEADKAVGVILLLASKDVVSDALTSDMISYQKVKAFYRRQ